MTTRFRLTIERNRLPHLGAATRRKLSAVVRKTMLDLEAQAKTFAPVDTGNLRNSVQGEMTGELAAEVAVGAEYGAFVEFGTVKSPAQPYLGPALETVRAPFQRAVDAAVSEAARE